MAKRGKRYYRVINYRRIIITIMVLSLVIAGVVLGLALARRGAGTLNIGEARFFVVAAGEFDTLHNANRSAQDIRRAGGAGYVVNDGDNFRVVVAVYARASEANSVSARLGAEEGFDTRVLELTIPPVSLSAYDRERAKEFADFFSHPIEVFSALMRHSLALEGGSITESHASTILSGIRTTLNQHMHRLSSFSDEFSDYVPHLMDFYREFSSLTTDALALRFGDTLAVNIRHLTVAGVYAWQEVVISLKERLA